MVKISVDFRIVTAATSPEENSSEPAFQEAWNLSFVSFSLKNRNFNLNLST